MSRLDESGELVSCPKPARTEPKKAKRVNPRSHKRIAETWERNETIKCVSFRANGLCQAKAIDPVPCSLDGWTAHEVVQRSVRPGSHLEPDLCIWTCGRHHAAIHADEPLARTFGLIRESWEVDEFGQLKPMGEAA